MELNHSYWLVSDRLKSLFEVFYPAAFAFQACDAALRDGSPGPVYWLCDVVRVLDAFGDETLRKIRGPGYRGFFGDKSLAFDESLIGTSHIFRTPYSRGAEFCDQSLKDACKVAGMKRVAFHACFVGRS
jgi:hypothetical protein